MTSTPWYLRRSERGHSDQADKVFESLTKLTIQKRNPPSNKEISSDTGINAGYVSLLLARLSREKKIFRDVIGCGKVSRYYPPVWFTEKGGLM